MSTPLLPLERAGPKEKCDFAATARAAQLVVPRRLELFRRLELPAEITQ